MFALRPPKQLGVAVSGGGDSMALLHLMREYAAGIQVPLFVGTVDHALRPESAAEAAFVADACAALNLPHKVLRWHGWDGSGNLQAEARKARYALLADWAKANELDTVALGHTADDQAETFLLRLARESGVDGLSAMEDERLVHGVRFVRPLLLIRREILRDYLREIGANWVDDPSNEDERFDRIKARKALEALEPLGINAEILGGVALNMGAARQVLRMATSSAAKESARLDRGDVILDGKGVRRLAPEIRRRLFVHALNWVSQSEYGPRRAALAGFEAALTGGKSATLLGCYAIVNNDEIRITREAAAVMTKTAAPGEIWDGRWRLSGPKADGVEVRATGEMGLKFCPDWRASGQPRATLLASPAIWRGEELVAAPLAGVNQDWTAELLLGEEQFFSSILSH